MLGNYEVLFETGRGKLEIGDIVKVNPYNQKAYGKHIQGYVLGIAINPTNHRNEFVRVLMRGFARISNTCAKGSIWNGIGIAIDENTIAINHL